MKTRRTLTLWMTCLLPVAAWAGPLQEDLPMVGTDAHGHAYPGATVPFGMVQLSPDTRIETWDGCSGYHYSDSTILGFSHTHLTGTGASCLGDVMLMPTVGEVQLDSGSPGKGYASAFSHDQEKAVPGYYSVYLATPKVTAELTASARCGFHKYTFPASEQSHLILDLAHGIGNKPIETGLKVEGQDTISGFRISEGWGGRRAVYFVMQFSRPFDSFGIEQDGNRADAGARDGKGTSVKASFNYKTADKDVILVKVGISGASIEGARKNLAAEIPKWDFEGVRDAASRQWQKIFDAVQVQSFDPHVQKTFYANLYLSSLAPTLFDDVDGTYRGYDHQNHPEANFKNYTTFSIWDIYRAEWPLLTLLQPGRVNDMVQSMFVEHGELGKHTTSIWPLWGNETWCMIGYHSVDMITEAYLDGFRGFDAEGAYQAMRDTAMQDRDGLEAYKRLGYVASSPGDTATSRTLEYTYDDWCMGRMAEALGHPDDAKMFYQRAANYRNLFDQTTQFFRGRKANGQWRMPFSSTNMVNDEYTEADAWQYAFAIQQDVPGMIELYGGDNGFVQKLDALFTADTNIDTGIPDISGLIGQDSQGDEQCHHVPYLYDYAGAPYKTQQRVRQIMSTLYNDTPAGQCGNVDCGQMAAWYVFGALGLYPMNPSSGILTIGSPVVTKAIVHLDRDKYHGRTFTVEAKGNSAENIYVQSATLNGKPLTRPWITRDELISGGTLRFVMGPNPNPQWGSAPAARPPATMPASVQYAPVPPPASTNQVALSVPIRVVCGSDEAVGDFLPDPNAVGGDMNGSDSVVDASASNAAPAAVYQKERYGKDFTFSYPVPKNQRYIVRLHFAEIFDDGARSRLENIYINRRSVLTDFDIFSTAGGMNKAVVKEFRGITANRRGNISIRVATARGSQDQNAKISAIEILKDETPPLLPFVINTPDGKYGISIDVSDAPDLADWADHTLAPVLARWYPQIVAMLPSEGFDAPARVNIAITTVDGVAYTTDTNVTVSSRWVNDQMNGEAVGSVVHELVHVVQQYGNAKVPGWLTEGMADYVRWFKYEPQSHGADMVWMRHQKNYSPHYDAGYRTTANFLNWVAGKYGEDVLTQVNAAARDGKYTADFWKQHTGKTIEELGAEWKSEVVVQLSSLTAADTGNKAGGQ